MANISLWRTLTVVSALAASLLATGCSSGITSASSSSSSSSSSKTATTTSFSASSYSATSGSSITLTVTVSPTAATGTVTFYDSTTSSTLCSAVTLSSGSATCSYAFSDVETHTVKATYSGDSTYASSSGSASVVVASASSTTTFAFTSYSVASGTYLDMTVTVSPMAATGTVTFYDSTTSSTLCSAVTLSSGSATCSYAFSDVETHTVKATYSGDSTYASSSGTTSVDVTSASSTTGTSTSTTLTTSSSTAYPGSLVILTATLSTTAATGAVIFYDKTSSGSYAELGSATLSSGVATLNTHFSNANTYTVKAVYQGDSTYANSTSGTVTETVATGSYPLDLSEYKPSSVTATYNSVSVTYYYYSNVVYAADPVSSSYESMNIFVPTKIGSTSVSDMPILLEICVGGYMSCQAGSSPGTNGTYALSKGYVVVEVGSRGRDNGSSGNYYGVAPAAIVDLKAAVRFLRYNAGLGASYFTGDVSHIIDSGGSAGGALASLLGASGDSSLYDTYLAAIGAADEDDNIFAVGAWSPITNLDNADGAYEMEYGSLGSVNSTISSALISQFEEYQTDLYLSDTRGTGYGYLTGSNITGYILTNFLEPSLEKYVYNGGAKPSYATCTADSSTYKYSCAFAFSDYVATTIGSRGKGVPAFDTFFDNGSYATYSSVNTSCSAESVEFGSATGSTSTYSGSNCSSVDTPRHFTDFSSEKMTGSDISSSMQTLANMMNPMYFLMKAVNGGDSSGVAKYWYIRDGAIATDTSIYVIMDLATAVEKLWGTSYVNVWEDWATGHNVNTDPSGFSSWVTKVVAAD